MKIENVDDPHASAGTTLVQKAADAVFAQLNEGDDETTLPGVEASSGDYLQATYANYLIFGASFMALAYGFYCYMYLQQLQMTPDNIKVEQLSEKEKEEIVAMQHKTMPPQTQQEAFDMMLRISGLIRTGANEFLKKEYTYLAVFCFFFSILIYFAVDFQESAGEARYIPYTTFAFYIGAATSMVCGYIGMSVATYSNVRTTWACNTSIHDGFHVAFKGGKVLGFVLVGLAILVLQLLIVWYRYAVLPSDLQND